MSYLGGRHEESVLAHIHRVGLTQVSTSPIGGSLPSIQCSPWLNSLPSQTCESGKFVSELQHTVHQEHIHLRGLALSQQALVEVLRTFSESAYSRSVDDAKSSIETITKTEESCENSVHLRTLDLSGNIIGARALDLLATWLTARCKQKSDLSLDHLALEWTHLPINNESLLNALDNVSRKNSRAANLHTLLLSHNSYVDWLHTQNGHSAHSVFHSDFNTYCRAIGDAGAMALAKMLDLNNPKKRRRSPNEPTLRSQDEPTLHTNFDESSVANSAVQLNNISFPSKFRGMRKLRVLHLRSCSIGFQGGKALAQALAHNSTLRELDLTDNLALGDATFEAFYNALTNSDVLLSGCMHLVKLSLANTNLTKRSAELIAPILFQSNCSLECIDLSSNPSLFLTGDEAVVHLCKALEQNANRTLRLIDLFDTGLRADGICMMFHALCNNKSIRSIDLRQNLMIGTDTLEKIQSSLFELRTSRNRSIIHLSVDPWIMSTMELEIEEYFKLNAHDSHIFSTLCAFNEYSKKSALLSSLLEKSSRLSKDHKTIVKVIEDESTLTTLKTKILRNIFNFLPHPSAEDVQYELDGGDFNYDV